MDMNQEDLDERNLILSLSKTAKVEEQGSKVLSEDQVEVNFSSTLANIPRSSCAGIKSVSF